MARPDGERRLHVELPPHDLLARLIDGILRAAPQGAGQGVLAARTQLGADCSATIWMRS